MLNIFLSILSATLLILAFPKPDFGFLAWFALVPWLFALQKQKPWRAFLLSYIVGVVFFSGILYWINYASRLGFTVLVLILALYFAVFGLLFSLRHSPSAISSLFFIPAVWVSLEYIRSHLFSGFGWALLGYSQYSVLPIIQISDITGAYGVSFLLVLVNVGFWQVVRSFQLSAFSSQQKISLKKFLSTLYSLLSTAFCALFLLASVLAYGYFKLGQQPSGQNIKVAVVQGNIPQELKWDPEARNFILAKYIHLTKQAALNHPELIIWPETAVPGYLADDQDLWAEITSLSNEISPAYLLVGTPQAGQGRKTYNSATLLFQSEIIQRYDKLHLVPFGEFIPWPEIFSRFSFASLIGDFSPGEDYTVFSLARRKPEVTFSVLICFEDVFAHLARRFVQKGAQFLVNITNDAWFRDSSEPQQHLQASVLRAVENRVNVVRSANTGVSCFINPWGKILRKVSDYLGRDVLVEGEAGEDLQIISLPSFYTAFGDIFAWLCLIGAVFALIRRRKL